MIYKDNTNPTSKDYYFYANGNYYMVARSQEKYRALFEKVGFKIVEEKNIHTQQTLIGTQAIETQSYMCILLKE